MTRIGQRVRDRELCPVRRAPERDPVGAERLAHRVDVVGVIAGRVEGARGADLRRALRDERLLPGRGRERIGLQLGAAENAGASGPPRIEGDQCVPRELAAEVEGVRAKIERAGRGLPGSAGDQE